MIKTALTRRPHGGATSARKQMSAVFLRIVGTTLFVSVETLNCDFSVKRFFIAQGTSTQGLCVGTHVRTKTTLWMNKLGTDVGWDRKP